jgi:hypothetical protein
VRRDAKPTLPYARPRGKDPSVAEQARQAADRRWAVRCLWIVSLLPAALSLVPCVHLLYARWRMGDWPAYGGIDPPGTPLFKMAFGLGFLTAISFVPASWIAAPLAARKLGATAWWAFATSVVGAGAFMALHCTLLNYWEWLVE